MVNQSGVVLRVQDVGYQVFVTAQLQAQLTGQASPVELVIYNHVSETALELYGFLTDEEKRLFLLLLDVSGVGPRTALAITNRGAAEIIEAVRQAQVSFFTQVPRVGKKMAQKIIIDLTSKLGSLKELQLGQLDSRQQEVASALTGMGFDESDVQEVIRQHQFPEDQPIEKIIKQVLQSMSKS